jgi:hypothetical protein
MQGMLETLRARAMHGKIEQVSSKHDVRARHVCHLAVDLVTIGVHEDGTFPL